MLHQRPPQPSVLTPGNSQKWKAVPGKWWPWYKFVFWSPRQSQEESQSIHTAEALTCQCLFKHFPANHHCLVIGRNKKNGLMCFISSNKWHHVGVTNKHCPAYNLQSMCSIQSYNLRMQSTSREGDPPCKNPLNGKNVSRLGSRWVFQVKQFPWWTISVWCCSLSS